MMHDLHLHRQPSSFGRLIQKPEKDEQQEINYDENGTVQEQIENLKIKISLKERYNKVQDEELQECRAGASTITAELWAETFKLRTQLMEALDAEKKAVHNALRSHKQFQLTLTGKVSSFALAWLDDKVFDLSKRLNRILDELACKRKRLKDAESMVDLLQISSSRSTSSTKWEAETAQRCRYLEYAIENMKVKRETASILHSKYHEIKHLLLQEKGHYQPALISLNNQLKTQRRELDQLNKMLGEAVVFQNDAVRNLEITEKEASENRKKRRRQMARMKKAVQKVLEDHMRVSHDSRTRTDFKANSLTSGAGEDPLLDSVMGIRLKKAEIEKYQDKARRLVDCMRVPDLTYIPCRLKAVYELAYRLKKDRKKKKEKRNFLLCQRDQLLLIFNCLTYTRQKTEVDFASTEAAIQGATISIENDIKETRKSIQNYGEITVDVRLALISILELLDEGLSVQSRQSKPTDTKDLLKLTHVKVVKFVKQIEDLKKQVPMPEGATDINTLKNFVRTSPVNAKLIRVGTPDNGDESDEDVYDDMSVPTRVDIKTKSAKVIADGMLKKRIV